MIQRVDRPRDMDNDRIFEDGRTQTLVIIPKGFDEGEKPIEIYFNPVLDIGYKKAVRSLLTSLTVEVVMGIDNLENVVADLLIEKTKPNRTIPGPLQQTVPAYAIFAMFFIAIPMSIGFLREKNDGTLQRLFTYPIVSNLVILGKLIPYYLINLSQFALMFIVGIYIMPLFIKFPFTVGAHPWHLIPVTLVVAAASTGFGVLIAALARAPEQSSALAATGAVLMAVSGGIMVPHVIMPFAMKKLAMISPMFWAHQAYLDVFLRDAAFSFILPKLVILTLFALVCFYIAGRRVKWM
jgi:ABC-2 type transport system permease protein